VKIATWNINSIKVRLDRVLHWLETEEPDALCLQETKVVDDSFPVDEIREAGYHSAVLGQRAYNGVAILSRTPPADVEYGMGPDDSDDEARLISANVDGVRVFSAYFPNGQTVGTDKWVYKLEWMTRLRAHLDRTLSPEDPVVLAGDFNVAPRDVDVHAPELWGGSVLCHPSVRTVMTIIRDWGFEDVFEKHNPEGGIFSWWDYQRLAFPKNHGVRIDHVYATRRLAERSEAAWVDRNARKKQHFDSKPSDHAPVVAVFGAGSRS
jgi:exodeoxyribonuclease-3